MSDPSTVQFGAEVEPSLGVDPRDPRVVVAAHQQDRLKTGASLGDVVSVSRDGGRTFRQRLLPGTSACEGGSGLGTDPEVSFAPDGTAYVSTQLDDGYAVSRSTDHGTSWQTVRAARGNPDLEFDDKDTLLADPTRPGRVYLAWDGLFGVQALGEAAGGLVQTALLTTSTDGGRSWSPSAGAYQPLSPFYSEGGPVLVARPDGELVLLLDSVLQTGAVGLPPQPSSILAVRSTDAGRTWSAPSTVARVPGGSSEVDDPVTGACVRTGGDCPGNHLNDGLAAAVEPDGAIDAIWQQDESAASGAIMLARSTDGGVRWSAPRAVVRAATQVFLPAIAVGPTGTIGIAYDAFRPTAKDARALDTDVYLTTSDDAAHGFATPVRLAGPFDMRSAPASTTESVGPFLGDYNGVVAFPDGFGVDFAASAPMAVQGASDVFFSRAILDASSRHPRHRGHRPRRRRPR